MRSHSARSIPWFHLKYFLMHSTKSPVLENHISIKHYTDETLFTKKSIILTNCGSINQGWAGPRFRRWIKLSMFFVFHLSNPYPLPIFLQSDYPIHIHYPCFWKAIIQSISIIHVFEKWLSNPYPLSMLLKTDYPIHIQYPVDNG